MFSQASRPNVLGAFRSKPRSTFSFFSARTLTNDVKPFYGQAQARQTDWRRVAMTVGTVGAAFAGTHLFLNRETRDALSPAEQSYLHSTFAYTAGGLALTAAGAGLMFRAGVPYRLMKANPWLVLGVSLVGSIGTMMGAMATPPENGLVKHSFWLAFNLCQAATLSPLYFMAPALLGRAALYTAGIVGSLSYVGATAHNDKFLYMGGPLLAGVTVVALSSLAPMVFPAMSLRALAISESIYLYGGLAVFGGFVLYDTQKILQHARMAQAGLIPSDPLKESISLQLDFMNIFIRLVQIMGMSGNRRK
ncbi:hypothetical protein PENSPDRAFT_569917 [Peniophora sp. CONT]|nr:hypothetical protein PENSPDRAFT_569917 [Peniophora sp. CONT]